MPDLDPGASPLDKARGAVAAAREQQDGSVAYLVLLQIAQTQAAISQAESLDRIAEKLAPRPRDERPVGRDGYA